MATPQQDRECEVCGKTGKAAEVCTFERCCCCWYGLPCVNGESMRQREKAGTAIFPVTA